MRASSPGWTAAAFTACAAVFGVATFSCGTRSSLAVPDHGPSHPCAAPTPLLVGGSDTGYDTCAGGVVRRRAIVDCPNLTPRVTTVCSSQFDGGPHQCTSDNDCTAKAHGACVNVPNLLGLCGCVYGCVRDSECGPQEICLCDDPVGQCYTASCNPGTCAPGYACALGRGPAGCESAFACQLSDDECFTDSDCGDGGACWIGPPPPPGSFDRSSSPYGPRACWNYTITCDP